MELEMFDTGCPFSNDNKSLVSLLPTFDLPVLIENLKHSCSWAKGELNSMILLKSPDRQILLTVLHDRTEIRSSQSFDSISFQIIEGKMEFKTRNKSIILNKGQLLTLHEKIKYRLTTMEETVFLLAIAKNTLKEGN